MIDLYDYQVEAAERMHNGCILCGSVGTGKSRTALAYYCLRNGGLIYPWVEDMKNPKDLYVITTAKKRDTGEWLLDMLPFGIGPKETNCYENLVVIDSWNNIRKYEEISGAFFIFDEQRVVGKGAWVKSFLKIARSNEWILLSATPGDNWEDYAPVFIANGFYRNRTDFNYQHIIFSRYCNFPKIEKYVNTRKLERLRDRILIDMAPPKQKIKEKITTNCDCDYDIGFYKYLYRERYNPIEGKILENPTDLCIALRKCINGDPTRLEWCLKLREKHKRVIIFYNFDYELEILLGADWGNDVEVAQCNGHKHQPLPKGNNWVYLVHYSAGAEGWNCTTTDTIIFYSQTYSYRTLIQAMGRTDRINSPYETLYYYILVSKAPIDLAIRRALKNKKKFNERKFVGDKK